MMTHQSVKHREPGNRHRLAKRFWCGVMAALIGFGFLGSVRGDVLWLDGDERPIFGLVEQVDDATLRFYRYIAPGERQLLQVPSDRIAMLIRTVDVARLEGLAPDHPQSYRNYGEELARFADDPESRELAIRLFTIAGYLADQDGNERLRESALRNLRVLARTDEERDRIVGLGKAFGIRFLARDTESRNSESMTDAQRSQWLAVVRSIRREQWQTAVKLMNQLDDGPNQKIAVEKSTTISVQDLESLVARRSISDSDLDRLLQLELWLQGQWQTTSAANNIPWSALASRPAMLEWIPDWDELNEFDPRRTVFRDGRWVAAQTNR